METKWISVKDRLPEENKEALIYYGEDIIQDYITGNSWKGSRLVTDCMNDVFVADRVICKLCSNFDFVTHWMPLPEKPKQ